MGTTRIELEHTSNICLSNTVGFIKGKSATRIHRELLGAKRMLRLSFWATGYSVSTVGLVSEE